MGNFFKKDVNVVLTSASKNSLVIPAREFIGKQLTISGNATAVGTVKVAVTPDLTTDISAAPSDTNRYSYVNLINLDDPSAIVAGSTGVAAVQSETHSYKINADYLTNICIKSDTSAGAITVLLELTNN